MACAQPGGVASRRALSEKLSENSKREQPKTADSGSGACRCFSARCGWSLARHSPHNPYLKALRCSRGFDVRSGESREPLARRFGIAMRRPPRSCSGDTEVAGPLAFARCRAPARRVIDHADPARPRIAPHGPVLWVRRRNAVIVSGLIDPFRRSHIFAVMGGMMVMSGDVAIKGRASGSSWVIRAYPPSTKRPVRSVRDRSPVS